MISWNVTEAGLPEEDIRQSISFVPFMILVGGIYSIHASSKGETIKQT